MVLLPTAETARATRPSLGLRMRVWCQRGRLDAEMADGVAPTHDPALALRADQLLRRSTRAAVARTIRSLVDAAEDRPDTWRRSGTRPPLQRADILDARDTLVELADRLGGLDAIPPQALAVARRLVWDSASPMYAAQPDTSVWEWADTIVALIDDQA